MAKGRAGRMVDWQGNDQRQSQGAQHRKLGSVCGEHRHTHNLTQTNTQLQNHPFDRLRAFSSLRWRCMRELLVLVDDCAVQM